MDSSFKIWKTNREKYLAFLENYSLAQLNKIPEGFSNNLIWNIGHAIVVQQRLIYSASGFPINISDELVNSYKPGSKPTSVDTQETVEQFKSLLLSLQPQTIEDYVNGKFVSYKELTTSTGFNIASIKDAIEFNNYHEGLHLGMMMNIRKFV